MRHPRKICEERYNVTYTKIIFWGDIDIKRSDTVYEYKYGDV